MAEEWTPPKMDPASVGKVCGQPPHDAIYTTGAHCEPRLVVSQLTGEVRWGWVVTEFSEGAYRNGEDVNPAEAAPAGDKAALLPPTRGDYLP